MLSEGDAVGTTQYTLDEMKAIVDEAHKLRAARRRARARRRGDQARRRSAGVASIEHGSFLDEEGARLMAQRGTFLVPTLERRRGGGGRGDERAPHRAARARRRSPPRGRCAAASASRVRAGVPIALGTDAGVGAHGTNAREFRLMVEWGGLTPTQALVAGTSSAAKLLGWQDRVGTLAAGRSPTSSPCPATRRRT